MSSELLEFSELIDAQFVLPETELIEAQNELLETIVALFL
jgi:hypothetical protein